MLKRKANFQEEDLSKLKPNKKVAKDLLDYGIFGKDVSKIIAKYYICSQSKALCLVSKGWNLVFKEAQEEIEKSLYKQFKELYQSPAGKKQILLNYLCSLVEQKKLLNFIFTLEAYYNSELVRDSDPLWQNLRNYGVTYHENDLVGGITVQKRQGKVEIVDSEAEIETLVMEDCRILFEKGLSNIMVGIKKATVDDGCYAFPENYGLIGFELNPLNWPSDDFWKFIRSGECFPNIIDHKVILDCKEEVFETAFKAIPLQCKLKLFQ